MLFIPNSFSVSFLKDRLKQFRHSEQGYILPLMLFMMLLFSSILFYLVDTGDAILRKTRLQQAADSAAISQAEWSARSLNVISMNNVAQTQLHTTRIIGASLHTYAKMAELKAWYVHGEALVEQAKVAKWLAECKNAGIPPVVAACFVAKGLVVANWESGLLASHPGAIPYIIKNEKYRRKVKGVRDDYSPYDGYLYSHSAFQTIHYMDDYLLQEDRANDLGDLGFEMAKHHGAENLYTFGGTACADRKCDDSSPIGIPLPATRAEYGTNLSENVNAIFIAKEFCNASKQGSPDQNSSGGYAGYNGGRINGSDGRGYEVGRGPWMHTSGKTVYDHVNDETRIGEYVGVLDDLWRNKDWPGFKNIPKAEKPIAEQRGFLKQWPPDGSNEQDSDSNAFIEMSKKLDSLYCDTYGAAGAVMDVLGLSSFSLPGLPQFGNMSPKPVGLKGLAGASNSLGSTPSSLLGRFTDSRHMSVFVVARDDGKISLPDQDDKISIYAYSQAQIYNPSAPDLYSQNWRARLVQASFLNGRGCDSILQNNLTSDLAPPRPEEVLDEMGQKAGGGYQQFIDSFDSFRSSCEDWGDVVVY